MPSVHNERLNQEWLDFTNKRTAIYKEAQENKKAKWQYRILKFNHDSKVADNNVFITCSVRNGYYEKFSGRKVLHSDITFNPTLPFAPRFLRCISSLTMAVCVTVYYRFCLS